jgi:hypothetical protein
MSTANIFLLLGILGILISMIVFSYLLIRNRNALNTKLLYIAAIFIHFYMGIVYLLVITGHLISYGDYIRPILLPIILLPVAISLAHRR